MRPRELRDEDGEEDDEEETACSNTDANTSSANVSMAPSSGARRNGGGAAAAGGWRSSSVSGPTINLSQEYTLAIQTNSYNEIWAKIHVTVDGQQVDGGDGDGDEDEEDRSTLAVVLRSDDAVGERVLGDAPDTELTRLAADYLRSTHHASLLCLSLHRALRSARALYGPSTDILALIPHAQPLAAPHCDCAFDAFLLFDRIPNPFLSHAAGFQGMHQSFSGLFDCSY